MIGRTVHLLLHFDGTGFHGWQRQSADRTVQGELEAVLHRLCGRRVVVHGAGRTDAGVHAIGMSASCTVPERWTPPDLCRALNALLPADCWVVSATDAVPGFHARRSATEREYRYDVGITPGCRSPFRKRYEWPLAIPLDRTALDMAAHMMLGDHDFRNLAVHTADRTDTRCRVRVARWESRGPGPDLRFRITANRFLHHMVRILVGTMVEIGRGRRPAEDIPALLEQRSGVRAAAPAPPGGLFFVAARYPTRWFPHLGHPA